MKKVITYGTFDLLHKGHINILKRAKSLGDYLVVGVTSENYDYSRGKLNVRQSLAERIENVKKTGFADEIIVEEFFGQKIQDIQKHNIDTFVIGSDWKGEFDYLNDYCKVVYLERTRGISSTELRCKENKIIKLGIIGNGRIAKRFIPESKYVSGIEATCVFGRNEAHIKKFAEDFELENYYTDIKKFYSEIDAVYIATPHNTHYSYIKDALLNDKHVLCEKPLCLKKEEVIEVFKIASEKGLILFEGIKTAYAPCFNKMINIAKSGIIGEIKNVEAAFTKLVEDKNLREYNEELGGGSFRELGSYPLCVIAKILGTNYKNINFSIFVDNDKKVDYFTKAFIEYENSIATATVGLGVKTNGSCTICGTKGYIYIPAPWWKTEYFEIRFENLNETQKYYAKFENDGLRYELAEFINSINNKNKSYKLKDEESIFNARVMSKFTKELQNKVGKSPD